MTKYLSRIIAVLLVLAMVLSLIACGKKEETVTTETEKESETFPVSDESGYHFSEDNFPVMDGSTSMVPLGQAITSVLLGKTRDEAGKLVHFNKTTQSFYNLSYGYCDVVIAAEPNEEVFKEMEKNDFKYELEVIAKEGLVFIVNSDNPVDSLTSQQVKDIYSGKITNWKEVGGNDAEIIAFQRNENAGSQVMMEKLVMQGTPMTEAPAEYTVGSMEGLIQGVKDYDNSANAIGYTVYYYANDMKMADGMKILAIDGIDPYDESIRNGDYAYINGYYCCIAADAPANSDARILYDWLISETGQQLLRLEGYVSVYDKENAPDKGIAVYADFSKYVPYNTPDAKYTRLDDGPLTSLTADDYGFIIPYDAGEQFGFFNKDGVIITDPIYSEIEPIEDYFLAMGGIDTLAAAPFWSCSRVDTDKGEPEIKMSFVSFDGTFVSDEYYDVGRHGDYIACFKDSDRTKFDLYGIDMKLYATEKDLEYQNCSVDFVTATPFGIIINLYGDNYPEEYSDLNYWYVDRNMKTIAGPFRSIEYAGGNYIVAYDSNNDATIYDLHGKAQAIYDIYAHPRISGWNPYDWYICKDYEGNNILVKGAEVVKNLGYDAEYHITEYHEDIVTIQDENSNRRIFDIYGNEPYEYYVNDGFSYLNNGILSYSADDYIYLTDPSTGKDLTIDKGIFAYTNNDNEIIVETLDEAANKRTTVLVDKDLSIRNIFDGYLSNIRDSITDQRYYVNTIYRNKSSSFVQKILDKDSMEVILTLSEYINIVGGCFTCSNDLAFTAYDQNGNVIFCYPYFGSASGD